MVSISKDSELWLMMANDSQQCLEMVNDNK